MLVRYADDSQIKVSWSHTINWVDHPSGELDKYAPLDDKTGERIKRVKRIAAGGETVCKIERTLKDGVKLLHTGKASCTCNDCYCKDRGRVLSLSRALLSLPDSFFPDGLFAASMEEKDEEKAKFLYKMAKKQFRGVIHYVYRGRKFFQHEEVKIEDWTLPSKDEAAADCECGVCDHKAECEAEK